VSADTIDEQIRWVLQRIGEFFDLDPVAVLGRLPEERAFWQTHQWVREGIPKVDGPGPEDAYPWAIERLVGRREPLVVSHVDDLPPEAQRDEVCSASGGSGRSPSSLSRPGVRPDLKTENRIDAWPRSRRMVEAPARPARPTPSRAN
jgi:hypothetical protein